MRYILNEPIDSLAAAGSILASVWLPTVKIPVVDSPGEAFLEQVKDGMSITIKDDGNVCVDCPVPYSNNPDAEHPGFSLSCCLGKLHRFAICEGSAFFRKNRSASSTPVFKLIRSAIRFTHWFSASAIMLGISQERITVLYVLYI